MAISLHYELFINAWRVEACGMHVWPIMNGLFKTLLFQPICRVWKQCLPACCVLVALESTSSAEWGSSAAASKCILWCFWWAQGGIAVSQNTCLDFQCLHSDEPPLAWFISLSGHLGGFLRGLLCTTGRAVLLHCREPLSGMVKSTGFNVHCHCVGRNIAHSWTSLYRAVLKGCGHQVALSAIVPPPPPRSVVQLASFLNLLLVPADASSQHPVWHGIQWCLNP